MKVEGVIFKTTRSIGAIMVTLFCLWLFPNPAFDTCSNGNDAFVCGQWPDVLMGFLFVVLGYLLGPKSKAHYYVLFFLFSFLGSAESIRFAGFYDAIYEIPFQDFYYGGFVAAFILFLVCSVKKRLQSVPGK